MQQELFFSFEMYISGHFWARLGPYLQGSRGGGWRLSCFGAPIEGRKARFCLRPGWHLPLTFQTRFSRDQLLVTGKTKTVLARERSAGFLKLIFPELR